jgi:hypothetical protein
MEENDEPAPGRWFHLGTDWFCDMLQACGFKILVLRLSQMVHAADPVMPAMPTAVCRRLVVGVNLLSVSEH